MGHYTLAFVQSQAGDPLAAISSSNHSRLLSPFDPLLFGMLGARAIAHVRLGQFGEAADWAVKSSKAPLPEAWALDWVWALIKLRSCVATLLST